MAVSALGGVGIGLPLPAYSAVPVASGGFSQYGGSNIITMQAGTTQLLYPGNFMLNLGRYTFLQFIDPITGLWRTLGNSNGGTFYVASDGANYRLANLTGTAVGAIVTNSGTGYTSAPTVTASAGGSTWTAIVGGAISGTVTITSAGSGYTLRPLISFSPPPAGGVPATGYVTLSAGAIATVVVTNRGAGYTAAPKITVTTDPSDPSAGSVVSGVLTAALTATSTAGGGLTIAAVVCTYPGTPVTALPTLSFAGGGGASAAATVTGCFTITGVTISAAGVAVPGTVVSYQSVGGMNTATETVVNPAIEHIRIRPANIYSTVTTGALDAAVIIDGGLFEAAPSAVIVAGAAASANLPTTAPAATFTIGGVIDTTFVQPI